MDRTVARLLLVVLAAAGCTHSAQKKAEAAVTDSLAMIGRQEQERAAPSAFQAYLADPDVNVRTRAVVAVARLEVLAGLAPLLHAMTDTAPGVRAAAAFGLGQLDLAIEPKISSHQAVRNQAEKALVDALAKEHDATVRAAIVRALGRVGDSAGVDALMKLAAAPGPERKEALLALGVNGKRRAASRSGDPGLIASVTSALTSGDDADKTAAAYAAFQEKLKIGADAMKAGMASTDPQARIFLARLAGLTPAALDDAVVQSVVDAGLKDADWRVRAEAVRAATARPASLAQVSALLDEATAALVKGAGEQGHIVRTACSALAASGAGPAQVKPSLEKALVTLAKTSDHRGEACACAVALDIVDPSTKSVERCDVDANDAFINRLRVQVIAGARTASAEKVTALAPLLKSDDVKVRMAAADALTSLDNHQAAELAAARLVDEEDFGVASTLIDQGPLAENPDLITDSMLYKLMKRFSGGKSFEQVEPLVTVATLAKARTTPSAHAVLTELQGSTEPRVKDAANGIPAGERAPGARASVVAASPSSVPLTATVKTTRGTIKIAFERERAASTVANFAALAKAKFYDGTPFHRVIADFVAQGGDKRGDGAGGPGYTIACENSDESFTRGAVGMATSGKDTGGSQFFFTHSWQPHLDGRYTLFARVTSGLEVMDALQPDDKILSVDIN